MNKVAFEIALANRGIHTTTALSNAVGISRQTLTPIRNEKAEPTQEVAEQIVKNLKLTDEEFSNIFPVNFVIAVVRYAATPCNNLYEILGGA